MTIETIGWIIIGVSIPGVLLLTVGTAWLLRDRYVRAAADPEVARLERIAAELTDVSRRLATRNAEHRRAS